MNSARARAAARGRARRRFLARLNVRWRCTDLGAAAAAHGTVYDALPLRRCVFVTRAWCVLATSPAGRLVARDVVEGQDPTSRLGPASACSKLNAPSSLCIRTSCRRADVAQGSVGWA